MGVNCETKQETCFPPLFTWLRPFGKEISNSAKISLDREPSVQNMHKHLEIRKEKNLLQTYTNIFFHSIKTSTK